MGGDKERSSERAVARVGIRRLAAVLFVLCDDDLLCDPEGDSGLATLPQLPCTLLRRSLYSHFIQLGLGRCPESRRLLSSASLHLRHHHDSRLEAWSVWACGGYGSPRMQRCCRCALSCELLGTVVPVFSASGRLRPRQPTSVSAEITTSCCRTSLYGSPWGPCFDSRTSGRLSLLMAGIKHSPSTRSKKSSAGDDARGRFR
jgi:hypothetical protein